jgi:hypothetical protein
LSSVLKCPHCGNEVTPNTRFCAACGSSLVPLTGPGDPTGVISGPRQRQPGFGPMQIEAPVANPYGSSPGLSPTLHSEPLIDKNRTIINFLSVAVVLLSMTVGILAVAWHRASSPGSQPCLVAPGMAPEAPAGAGEVHLPSAAGFATPSATGDDGGQTYAAAADDAHNSAAAVADYLTFVGALEQRRVELQAAATNDAMASNPVSTSPPATASSSDSTGTPDTAPQAPPDDTAASSAPPSATDGQWEQLVDALRAQTPPSICSTMAADYLNFLSDSKVAAGKTPAAANAANALVDDAARAEADLEGVCSILHEPRPFTITAPPGPVTSGTSGTSP